MRFGDFTLTAEQLSVAYESKFHSLAAGPNSAGCVYSLFIPD
jgi:hypothetical protein